MSVKHQALGAPIGAGPTSRLTPYGVARDAEVGESSAGLIRPECEGGGCGRAEPGFCNNAVWHNNDDTAHNIAFEIEFDGIPTMDKPRKVRMTERWAFTFDKAGVYKYACKIHLKYDMNGVIVVKD